MTLPLEDQIPLPRRRLDGHSPRGPDTLTPQVVGRPYPARGWMTLPRRRLDDHFPRGPDTLTPQEVG